MAIRKQVIDGPAINIPAQIIDPGAAILAAYSKGPSPAKPDRETSIVRQAVIKSVLESPAFEKYSLTIKQDQILPEALRWAEEAEKWVNR